MSLTLEELKVLQRYWIDKRNKINVCTYTGQSELTIANKRILFLDGEIKDKMKQ